MLRRMLSAMALLCAAMMLFTSALASDADTYFIEVDIDNQITTVYRMADGSIARQMLCSSGVDGATPLGTFRLERSRSADRREWYYIGKYGCYVKYPTRIQGAILFHSIPYAAQDMDTIDEEALAQLGSKASHGCIRLCWEDAQWIAENCPDGTMTRIFSGAGQKAELRALLLAGSYTGEGGMSYEAFLSPRDEPLPAPLTPGDTGDVVDALQRRLSALGCYDGAYSGEYDAATVVAVMRYQALSGMTANGIATPALVRRILSGR